MKKPVTKKRSLLKNKTLIIGCGRLGSSMANKCALERKNIIVVDRDADAFDRLADTFGGFTLAGDSTDLSILEEAHILSAKEIIITTGDDNINLFLAHVARKIYDVPEIYVRLDNPDNEVLLKGLNVKAIFPFELSYDKFNLLRGGRK